MNPAVNRMLERYQCETRPQYERALKEILQELALVGLWRAKFFEHAAFYGGTALRILYNLDRFSEDLDFTLLVPSADFSLDTYNAAIKSELESFGFQVEVDTKTKQWRTPIRSAFIKTQTLGELIKIGVPRGMLKGYHPDALMKIKLEVDTDPAEAYRTETRFLTRPFSVGIRSVTLSDMFAGKMHALLYREWKGRVKGRDWFDWIWFVRQETTLQLDRLAVHMRKNGTLEENEMLTAERFKEIVYKRIDEVDIESARLDLQAFATDSAQYADWSKDLFRHMVDQTILQPRTF